MSDHDQIEPHICQRFEIVKKKGSGAYGVVWKVLEKRTHKHYALKKNFDAFQNSTDAQRTYRQIMFLQKLKHPHIVQLKQVIRSHSQRDIYILFEYMDIDLYTLIRQNLLADQHKQYIIYQIGKALHYLHTVDLIHRDIKPSNVLVNEDCLSKICDFGLVRSVDEEIQELTPILTEYIATRWYRAPQILLGSKKYSKAADVWSFGCMLGEIIRGKPMFPGHSTLNQIQRVLTWTGPPNIQDLRSLKTDFGKEMLDLLTKIKPVSKKDWFPNCPPEALDLISWSLSFNPQKRPTMLEFIKHPYLKQFYSKQEIIEGKGKIRVEIDDNKKLTLKQYRHLIYKIVDEDEEKNNKMLASLSEVLVQKCQTTNLLQTVKRGTIYKNRPSKGLIRSASKNKEESIPKSTPKQCNTVSLQKKYDSLMGKGMNDKFRTKYIKTQEVEQESLFPKRKKSDHIVKYHTSYKKKKSVSLYEAKKDSEFLAKYMFQNRKI